MAEIGALSVSPRPNAGKGPARALRRAGKVPAIVYGASGDAVSIAIDPTELAVELGKPGFFGRLYDLDIEGRKERVLCRDVQFHPVKDVPMHADFLRVSEATRITAEVTVNFINEEICVGLKKGGVINIVRHAVELSCRADSIPSEIVIDLEGRDIGDSIHISEIDLPEGVVPTITDRDFTIATIAAPTVTPAEDEEDEAAEGVPLEGEEAPVPAEGEAEES